MSTDGSADAAVKKRTLSSYLSNVTSRREELEKLKHKVAEHNYSTVNEKKGVEEQQGQESQQQPASLKEIQAVQHLNKEHDEPSNEGNKKITQMDIGCRAELAPSLQVQQDSSVSSVGTDGKQKIQNEASGSRRSSHNERNAQTLIEPLYNKDSEARSVELNDNIFENIMPVNENGPEITSNDERIINNDEIDSDAPTEPASPPRPRRGRLVRGDRLTSLSPRNKFFDNESDSELSDIDELKSVHLSSSILHGDSSPARQSQQRFKDFQEPSSPRKSSPKKPGAHVALPKVPKQKKGLYRDAGGRTRLQIACDKGNYELAKKLILEGNYDVNDQDNAGNSALHEAALNGHLELVKLLTINGADVNIQSFEMFKDTPLIDASANGHLDVVTYLLGHGADPTISNAKGLTAYESIEDSDLDDHERAIVREIRSCLRGAARKRNDNIEIPTKTPSEKAAMSTGRLSPPQKKQTEELLGEYEFFWTDITSRAGRQKLFKSSKEGNLAYVGAYLENGGRVDVKSFFEAVKFGHEDITSLFLAFGAQVNAVLKNGTTALMASVGRGHVGTVKLLLDAGADPTKKNKNGHTALYNAQNSAMGVVDKEEIELLKKAIQKFEAPVDDVSNYIVNNKIASDKKVKLSKDDINSNSINKDFDDNEEQNVPKVSGAQRDENHLFDENASGSIVSDYDGDKHTRYDVDDEEDLISVGRKRKTTSPAPLQPSRQTLSHEAVVPTDKMEDPIVVKKHKPEVKVEVPVVNATAKLHEETAEEREQRLKAEEEYVQRRLQNKKRKEQELLRKLAQDEEKRQQERSKQKIEEARRIETQQREKELELDKQKQAAEVARRKEIRAMYPLGLKVIDFKNNEDYMDYLPLYYVNKSNAIGVNADTRYVLDLQICVILKDEKIFSTDGPIKERIEVSVNHKRQLWNVLRFILLCGGYRNSHIHYKYIVDPHANTLEASMMLETTEYHKFLQLPLHWIRWDNISIDDTSKKERIENEMVELSLLDSVAEPASAIPSASHAQSQSQSPTRTAETLLLPIKLQHRESTSWLADPTSARQMW